MVDLALLEKDLSVESDIQKKESISKFQKAGRKVGMLVKAGFVTKGIGLKMLQKTIQNIKQKQ